jgi:predicted ester cyclase
MDYSEYLKEITIQLFVKGNLKIVEDYFSEQYVAHSQGKDFNGLDFVKKYTKSLRKSITELKLSAIEIITESEGYVSWQRTFSGIHQAAIKGIPPSFKKVKWTEMVVSRIENGKITEEWVLSDLPFQLMIKHK